MHAHVPVSQILHLLFVFQNLEPQLIFSHSPFSAHPHESSILILECSETQRESSNHVTTQPHTSICNNMIAIDLMIHSKDTCILMISYVHCTVCD